MIGYLGKEDKTSETFTSDGWLRSGDIGKIDKDGYLTITGRLKGSFENSLFSFSFFFKKRKFKK